MRELGIEVLLGVDHRIAGNGHARGGPACRRRASSRPDLVVVADRGQARRRSSPRAPGLEVSRGVVVDDELRTSAPGGWAVGECAEHRGVVYGLWAPLLRQAKAAGAGDVGQAGRVPRRRPGDDAQGRWASTSSARAGPQPREGEEELLSLDSRRGRYRKLVLADDRLVGAVLLGDLDEAVTLRRSSRTARTVPPELLETGRPRRAADRRDGLLVRVGHARADRDGDRDAKGSSACREVARATGARTGCGSCRAQVERILAEHRGESLRDIRAARSG